MTERLQASKELIRKYIEEHDGKKIKKNVVDYMNSEVPEELRISRVPTLNLIKELQSENRIKVKGKRQGQSHFLSINNDSRFESIVQQLVKIEKQIEKIDEDKPETILGLKKGGTISMPSHMFSLIALCWLSAQVSRDIKNKDDLALLNDKILQLIVDMGMKNIRQWSKKLPAD